MLTLKRAYLYQCRYGKSLSLKVSWSPYCLSHIVVLNILKEVS